MGKTSFFNLIKSNLSSDDHIIIDFNSWNSSSPKAIIQDFFDSLQEELRPYYSSLAQQIVKYSDKLAALNDNSLTQSIKATAGILAGDNSISSFHSEINKKLKKIDKKIIIFIDDLDRLDKHEILEVMRLIRNTANFYNTIFLVAYDRDYVLKAISEFNPHNFQSFLEKIFQLEINLPYFNSNVFKDKLAQNLKELLPDYLYPTVEETLFGQPYRNEIDITKWISSIRDVTRLSNSISVTMQGLQGEVYFKDFLYLQLLRLKYPSIYEEISKNYTNYFKTQERGRIKHQYFLKVIERYNDQNKRYSYVLEEHLHNNLDQFLISASSVKDIIELLDELFNKHTYDWHGKFDHLSVVYPLHFRKYFTYNLTNGNLSYIEFTKARAASQEEFNRFIASCVKKGLQLELMVNFENIRDFDNREDFEKVIKGIFHYANEKAQAPYNSLSRIVGYDANDLKNKLSDYDCSISRKYYDSSTPSPAYKSFFRSLFEGAKFPYSFESYTIGNWLDNNAEQLPLSIDELAEIAINYLEQYSNRIEKIDDHLWRLLNYCKLTNRENAVKEEVLPERAKTIFRNFIVTKDIDGFLFSMINPDRIDNGKFKLSNYILTFWNSWEDFLTVLEANNKHWKYIDEFIEFYKQVSSNGFESAVVFNFKIIPLMKDLGN